MTSRSSPSKSTKNSGFTLIEVLFAVMIMSIVTLGIIASMEFLQRSSASIKASSDFNSVVNLVQGVLDNSVMCSAVFNGAVLPITTSPVPVSISVPFHPLCSNGSSPCTGNTILDIGTSPFSNNLSLTKMEFNSIALIISNQFLANFHIEGNRVVAGPGAVGGSLVQKNFPLTLALDMTTGKILNCSGMTDKLWQLATNGLDFYNNPSTRNVGIGTSTFPPYSLTVSPGGTGSGLGIGWNASGINGETDFYNYGQGGQGGFSFNNYPAPGGSYPVVGANNLMTITSLGSVGIGTVTPQASLDVNGGVRPGTVADALCTAQSEGVIRYDLALHTIQYCSQIPGAPVTYKFVTMGGGLGVGQSWNNLSTSRIGNFSYQNTTGSPIAVSVTFYYPCGGGMTGDIIYVGPTSNPSEIAANSGTSATARVNSAMVVVPNNYFYRAVAGNCSNVAAWYELR